MVRFGPFEVDFATSEMRKSGVRVRIQDQPLRILEALLERPGQHITREELRDRLWPSDTFVDFERSLNAAVGKLRQSLNDSADHPVYVETVARKGYRFIAPLAQSESKPLPSEHTERPPHQLQPAHVGQGTWALAAGLGAALAGLLVWAVWPTPRPDSEKRVVALDLDVGGEVSQPAISPDGTTLAFVASGRLAVRKLEQTRITPLAGTEGASSPFFSPDGRWVGYFAGHQLRKVGVDGGESVMLCDAPFERGGTWTEDGIIASLSASGELSSIPSSGGLPRPFSSLKGERPYVTVHRGPVALPGGKGTLFVSGTGVTSFR